MQENTGFSFNCEFSAGTFADFHTLGEDDLHTFGNIMKEVLGQANFADISGTTVKITDQTIQPVEASSGGRKLWSGGAYGNWFAGYCWICLLDNSDATVRRLQDYTGIATTLKDELSSRMAFFNNVDCARLT
eukprot:CAMPEP_0194202728 /NCGR_PEP_ID=MMETSP0156-20130528/2678_1 /TAXON_ID=33649 /ORGANISM="Thalassionema nitzschioides, Strain L26-B" /LENGTH=131 /DNA_ID=CAMNT_0038928303 /DNA_START=213 /DNA_END=604 /DNA_ORIENTATION=+